MWNPLLDRRGQRWQVNAALRQATPSERPHTACQTRFGVCSRFPSAPPPALMFRSLLPLPLALLLASGSGCSGSQPAISPDVQAAATGEPFRLPLGESVQMNGHTLRFVDVVEDSRCPKETTCVWEGRAKVHLSASAPGAASARQVLTLPYASMTDEEQDTWFVGGMTVRILALTPASDNAPQHVELAVTSD